MTYEIFYKCPVFFFGQNGPFAEITQNETCLQPFRSFTLTDIIPITVPLVFLRSCNNPCPDWIQVDVSGKFRCIFIRFNKDCLESTLEEVSCSFSLEVT